MRVAARGTYYSGFMAGEILLARSDSNLAGNSILVRESHGYMNPGGRKVSAFHVFPCFVFSFSVNKEGGEEPFGRLF